MDYLVNSATLKAPNQDKGKAHMASYCFTSATMSAVRNEPSSEAEGD